MKLLIAACLFAVVGLSLADTVLYPRGCIYALGKCVRECEVGTHAYTTGCGVLKPEPTCDDPNPAAGKGIICDYSACYCDPPTVKDKISGKCLLLEDCPK
ncbi:uncharacterized protein LOC119839109 [Zerene cesonia]|uniref:uncharacterized protein LOC119839109 n=1 Tax=Zerene cesonia TaxID=33412 RepID=UPI0018E5A4A5|nr:uncharacterized protein LOC119839109 [Zerene cesonia]